MFKKSLDRDEYWDKKNCIRIAKELGYSHAVIEKLQNANSLTEVSRIMHTARDNASDAERS